MLPTTLSLSLSLPLSLCLSRKHSTDKCGSHQPHSNTERDAFYYFFVIIMSDILRRGKVSLLFTLYLLRFGQIHPKDIQTWYINNSLQAAVSYTELTAITAGHGGAGEVPHHHHRLLQGRHGLHIDVRRDQRGVIQQRPWLVRKLFISYSNSAVKLWYKSLVLQDLFAWQ